MSTDAIVKTTRIIFRNFLEQQRTKGEGWIQNWKPENTIINKKKNLKELKTNLIFKHSYYFWKHGKYLKGWRL